MGSEKVANLLDHKRWLLNSGLADDGIMNDLYTYGAICHPKVKAVECSIDVLKKLVVYNVYLENGDFETVLKFAKLSKSKSLFGLWRFKRLIKQHGNLHIHAIIQRFIRDYCGPTWNAHVEVKRLSEYVESPNGEGQSGKMGAGAIAHQQPNGG